MKKTIILIIIILSFSCGNNRNKHLEVKKENQQINENKGKIYYLHYNSNADFEIIFNGVSLIRNNKIGVVDDYQYLNPYINKKGIQTLSLKIKPHEKDDLLTENYLKNISIDIYYSENDENPPFKLVKKCELKSIEKPVKIFIDSWTFEAEVPYNLIGLENSQSFLDKDQNELLEKVIEKYSTVNRIINNGDTLKYLEIYKKSREREMNSMYYDVNKQKEYLNNIVKRVQASKGFMQPISDYRLFIHPNGKLVQLINSNGTTPLFSIDDKGKRKSYGLILHQLKGVNKLKVY
ncbi:hypothetical protein AX016_1616 [Cellulophaga sp. RHA19]|uniref:hypothetical protein n=1 Tax=Cellulophaga sp. RHA19 TaxID=1798237 RepID=UPI000C2C3AA0|nr:hypothetical protein [Cellulophaga sp. RHA19]PKB43422.1 hypothetical protein AX016_1616 [Cellulophaga sp. RHA19]